MVATEPGEEPREGRLFERRRTPHTGHGVPAEPLTLVPFLGLARELTALFVPPRMRPEFRTGLEQSLLIAGHQQRAQAAIQLPAYVSLPRSLADRVNDVQVDRRWVVGAAVGSAVSIASIVALVWRYRSRAA